MDEVQVANYALKHTNCASCLLFIDSKLNDDYQSYQKGNCPSAAQCDEFRVFHHQASYNRHLYICKVIYRLFLRKDQVLHPSLVHCNMGSHHSPSHPSMGTVDSKPQTPWQRSKHNCRHSMDEYVCILFQVDLLC